MFLHYCVIHNNVIRVEWPQSLTTFTFKTAGNILKRTLSNAKGLIITIGLPELLLSLHYFMSVSGIVCPAQISSTNDRKSAITAIRSMLNPAF